MAVEQGGGLGGSSTTSSAADRPYSRPMPEEQRKRKDRGGRVPSGWASQVPPQQQQARPPIPSGIPAGWQTGESGQRGTAPRFDTEALPPPIPPQGWGLSPLEIGGGIAKWLQGLNRNLQNAPVSGRGAGPRGAELALANNRAWSNAISSAFGFGPRFDTEMQPNTNTPINPPVERRQFRDTGYHGRGSLATNPYIPATYPTVPPPPTTPSSGYSYGGWGGGWGGGGGGGGYGGSSYEDWLKSLLTRWNF